MTDNDLINGAAAPDGRRRIGSIAMLDAAWVVLAASSIIASSRFALIDLPDQSLRTGDSPARFFVLELPVMAIIVAVVGAARSWVRVTAVATGMLAPSVALTGSLAMSLFLDESSAFADVGVSVSVMAALIGSAALVRWFVYHPVELWRDDERPALPVAGAMAVAGVAAMLCVVIADIDDASSAAWVGPTSFMLVVPTVIVIAAVVRTVPSAALAVGAAVGQVGAVLAVKLRDETIAWDSDFVLRTGVAGLALLITCVVASVLATFMTRRDASVEVTDDDAASWRWNADD